MGAPNHYKKHMLPNSTPPQDVTDLVNQYKADPTKYELVIHDNLFLLYEITLRPAKDGEPVQVYLGNFVRRAYWRDAAGVSLEMIKTRLGIR